MRVAGCVANLLVAWLALGCSRDAPPAATHGSQAPRATAALTPPEVGTTATDAAADVDASATHRDLPEAGTLQQGAGGAPDELLNRRYGTGKRYCFRVVVNTAPRHTAVAQFDSPGSVSWWLALETPANLDRPALREFKAQFQGSLKTLHLASGRARVAPQSLAHALAFLDRPELRRLQLRGPIENPEPKIGGWIYEAVTADGRELPIRYHQDSATGRVTSFGLGHGGQVQGGRVETVFLEEAELARGQRCPFARPGVDASSESAAQ